MKYKIIFSYDGTNFNGYAKQINVKDTIQDNVEKAISTFLNAPTKIYASGRTDKGVHALNQVACFESQKSINRQKFLYSINKLTSEDIFIKNIAKVDDTFDARISAKSKTYLYIINHGEFDVFRKNNEEFIKDINVKKLKEISKIFIGEHNFQNYCSKEEDNDNFVRKVYSIRFKEIDGKLHIEFKGNGFMRYMVRKLMGTMIAYAQNKITKEEAIEYLTKKERDIIVFTANPKGLYLKKVEY